MTVRSSPRHDQAIRCDSESKPEQRLQVPLDRLVARDGQMLGLHGAEDDAVVSSVKAAIVELAIVKVDRVKARIGLNGLIASVVMR